MLPYCQIVRVYNRRPASSATLIDCLAFFLSLLALFLMCILSQVNEYRTLGDTIWLSTLPLPEPATAPPPRLTPLHPHALFTWRLFSLNLRHCMCSQYSLVFQRRGEGSHEPIVCAPSTSLTSLSGKGGSTPLLSHAFFSWPVLMQTLTFSAYHIVFSPLCKPIFFLKNVY